MHWALASTLFVMSLTSMSPADASSTPVVVNEVHCQGNDWIELYNTSSTAFDLSGWGVSDKNPNSASLRHRYMFLSKTTIGPKGYLVVEQKGLGSLQLTFGVSCAGGESIRLFKSITSASFETVSEIYVPKIPKKSTYGRLPNGSGAFGLTTSTKRRSNVAPASTLMSSTNLKCSPQKSCAFKLVASNDGKFQILKADKGVSISAGRTLHFAKHKRGTYVVLLKMSSASGSKNVSLSVHVK